jgi:hypothetical protein
MEGGRREEVSGGGVGGGGLGEERDIEREERFYIN